MRAVKNIIQEIRVISPKSVSDNRGFFRETYRKEEGGAHLRGVEWVQDNESFSLLRGTLRGLHFQRAPHAQAKLVRVAWGAIFDVVVDLRQGSSTFGQWAGYELSAENGHQLFVPVGFAHGFCTLVENTVVCYKVSDYYAPDCDGGIVWNDPSIGINWRLDGQTPILSEKDAVLPTLTELGDVF